MTDQPDKAVPKALRFHYIKSNFFRVVLAEGAYGGITPRGLISFALYNERNAIPRVGELAVEQISETEFRPAGVESPIEGIEGIVREVEVEVAMNLDTAISFHKWLGDKIRERSGSV